MLSWITLILIGIWYALKWSFKWIFAPLFIGIGIFWAVVIISLIPFVGALLHCISVIVAFFNMWLPLLESQSTWKLVLVFITLLLAFTDCIYDIVFTAKTKLYKSPMDDNVMIAKWVICGFLSAVGAAVYYYTTPSDQSRITNIISHGYLMLFLLVLPRALFVIHEIYAIVVIYPKALKAITSESFFKVEDSSYFHRYIKWKQREGIVISNESTIQDEKRISQIKLDKKFPKTMMAKLTEKLAGDKHIITERDNEKKI